MRWMISRLLRIATIVSAVILGLVIVLSGVAHAITNGQPDENNHPYVCVVVMLDEDMQFVGSGSGILISQDVVLTAGHVTDAGSHAFVTFAANVTPGSLDGYIHGFPDTHPQYRLYYRPGLRGTLTHDVGVIRLDSPVIMDEYGQLPDEGAVDSLAAMRDLDLVGYGFNHRDRPSGDWIFYGSRYHAQSKLIPSKHVHSDEFIKVTSNPAQGKGGMCFGDSGGPVLLGDTNIILGLISYGTNFNCAGLGYAARVDTVDVLKWINDRLL